MRRAKNFTSVTNCSPDFLFFSVFLMTEIQLEHFSNQILSVIFLYQIFIFGKIQDISVLVQNINHFLHLELSSRGTILYFFPIILIFLWKFFKNKIIFIILSIIFASLILAQFGGNFKLQNLSLNPPFYFYLLNFLASRCGNFYVRKSMGAFNRIGCCSVKKLKEMIFFH